MMINKFKVIDKRTGLRYSVYAINNDSTGCPRFLVYSNGQWKWSSAKRYVPQGK